MAQEVFTLNEESFERIINILIQLTSELNEHLDGTVKQIVALSNEWDDEDYQIFLESFNGIENDLKGIDNATVRIVSEAKRKLEMIQARRNIKM